MIVPREDEQNALFSRTLMSFEPYLQANRRTKKTVIINGLIMFFY